MYICVIAEFGEQRRKSGTFRKCEDVYKYSSEADLTGLKLDDSDDKI